MKNTIGFFKRQGISETGFPLVLFSYEWEHIKKTGFSHIFLRACFSRLL